MNTKDAKENNGNRVIAIHTGEEITLTDEALAKGSDNENIIFRASVSRKGTKKIGMEVVISVYDVNDNTARLYYFTLQEAKILADKLSKAIKKVEEREGDFVVIDGKKYKLTEVVDSQEI